MGSVSIGLPDEEDNLFNNENWTEKLPLVVSHQQPVFYKDFIDVSSIAKLKFTAKLRDTNTLSPNNDLLVVEFYDGNYNILTDYDIANTDTNFEWSSFYKYWWDEEGSYFDIDSWGCNDNGNDKWYNNQWNLYERQIDIPEEVKYIRVSFHKLSNSDEEFLILNPTLIGEKRTNLEVINPLYAFSE